MVRPRSLLKKAVRVVWGLGDFSSRKEEKGVYAGNIVEVRVSCGGGGHVQGKIQE